MWPPPPSNRQCTAPLVHVHRRRRNLGLPGGTFAIDVAAAAFKSPMYRQAVPGFFDVGVHGQAGRAIFKIGEDVWVNLRREEVAEVMLAGGYVPGTPIRLISCESGSTARGFAAFLSKQFDAYLIAPSHRVEL